MDAATTGFIVFAAIGLAVAALAWAVLEVGLGGLARYRAAFTERARFQAQEFFLFIDPRSLFAAHLSAMVLGAVLLWVITGSAWIAVAGLALLAAVPRIAYAQMRRRRLRQFEAQLPDALLMLGGALRSGVGISSALQQLVAQSPAPIGQEFALVLREQRLGVSLDQSLLNLQRRVPTQTTSLVVSAMRIAGETGGALAETLERTSATVRSRLQMEGKIDALTSQGRLQAWVVGALPIVLLLVLQRMEPAAMALLWSTPAGWACLGLIAFLEVMGIYLIRRIVAIDV
jgi:tight adherence protein B